MFIKDPNANLNYSVDWSDWLEEEGGVLVASSWVVPEGLVQTASSFDETGTTIWLSGGVAGRRYFVTNRITTSENKVDDRSIEIHCRSR